jgi:hypothetical protein
MPELALANNVWKQGLVRVGEIEDAPEARKAP